MDVRKTEDKIDRNSIIWFSKTNLETSQNSLKEKSIHFKHTKEIHLTKSFSRAALSNSIKRRDRSKPWHGRRVSSVTYLLVLVVVQAEMFSVFSLLPSITMWVCAFHFEKDEIVSEPRVVVNMFLIRQIKHKGTRISEHRSNRIFKTDWYSCEGWERGIYKAHLWLYIRNETESL